MNNYEIFKKIPIDFVENIRLYRLGIFKNSSIEIVRLEKNIYYPQHFHKNSKAKFYFILGEGKIIIEEKELRYKKGSEFILGKGIKHGFKPEEETLFLSIQTPPIKIIETGIEDIHF